MNQSIKIAVRNVSRQRKRTVMLGGAVAFGFFIITIVDAFTGGIVATVKDNFSYAFGGHLYLTGSVVSERGSEITMVEDDSVVREVLGTIQDEVASIHRRSTARAVLTFGSKERSLRIDGVDFADEQDFAGQLEIKEGSLADLGKEGHIILPADTAQNLGVAIGESLLVKASTVTGQQNLGEFILIATTPDSNLFGAGRGYTAKSDLNRLIDLPEEGFQTINVYLRDVEDSSAIADELFTELARRGPVAPRIDSDSGIVSGRMRGLLGVASLKTVAGEDRWTGTKFGLTTIEDVISPILSLVTTLNMISLGVFVVLLTIIMIGILNSYRMVMIERTTEIGTMRAIGVQKKMIRNIFLLEALVIAALGAVCGFILGISVAAVLSQIEFGTTSILSLFLSKGHLGFAISWSKSTLDFLLLCAMSLMAVYLPARRASRLDPAQSLRTSY